MKIVFLDFDDIKNPLLGAGQAKATYEVGRLMAKRGHEVISVCSRYPGSKDRTEKGIQYKHVGIGTKNIRLNNAAYIAMMPAVVPRLKADIIVECFTAPISTMMTPLLTKTPVVAVPTSFEASRFSELYHLPFHRIEKLGLTRYKYFLPFNVELEDRMKEVNPEVVSHVIPNGVDKTYFKIKKAQPKYILFLGRFDIGQKGIDLLLKAYAKISSKVAYSLVIAGFGTGEKRIHELIHTLGLENRVTVVGRVDGKRKEELLASAVFVAFPSRHEGFSLFSLEALASGNALAGFDIPGLKWADQCVALKAKPFDVDEYARVLKKMCEPGRAKKMGIQARKIARQYTWERVAREYEAFFKTITENGGKKYEN